MSRPTYYGDYNRQSSSQRPSSAGATRRPAYSYGTGTGYAKNTTTSANTYGSFLGSNNGLTGTAFSAQQNQRPTSAGHARPSASNNAIPAYMQQSSSQQTYTATGPTVVISGRQPTTQLPTASGSSSGGVSRPKSAGAVRTSQQQPQAQQTYQLPQPQPQSQQQPQKVAYFGYGTSAGVTGVAANASYRPTSASATQQTSQQTAQQGTYGSDNWSTSYKLHYGSKPTTGDVTNSVTAAATGSSSNVVNGPPVFAVSSATAAAIGIAAAGTAANTIYVGGQAPKVVGADSSSQPVRVIRPASASARIRSAISESQKYSHNLENGSAKEEEGEDMGLDAKQDGVATGSRQTAKDEDDEMDGKPIESVTRSHPEVSAASPSVEIGLSIANSSAAEFRNNSVDSLQEDVINVGLSTVPNQFCSVREAVELKKLLILSKNSLGGIVPSSTAVMDMYMVGKVLGVGSYGKVRAAWHRLTGSKVAIKTYDKSKLKDPAHWKRVHSEIKIMEQLSHPRIARMYEAVETPKRMHLIMECLDGGNLCSYVKAKRRLSEEESQRIFYQILTAIDHLHSVGVTHRDIKLENVLFVDNKDSRDVKLIDFGFSTVCQPGKKLKVFCGTPSYMAPEIVQRMEYEGKAVDMWSLGILLYALLCGCFPFRAKSYPDLYRRIARGTFAIPEELSPSVRDLLRQLLTVDPIQRITAHASMKHSWLQSQSASAPDMGKMRLDTAILISDRAQDDLDDQVIVEITTFGLPKDDLVQLVLSKTHSSIATLYYLLLDNVLCKRKILGGNRRALSSSSAAQSSGSSNFANRKVYGIGAGASAGVVNPATMTANTGHPYFMQQQQVQMTAAQQQQQQQQARQEYISGYAGGNANGGGGISSSINRPKSASNGRGIITGGGQRPLSAYAGRR